MPFLKSNFTKRISNESDNATVKEKYQLTTNQRKRMFTATRRTDNEGMERGKWKLAFFGPFAEQKRPSLIPTKDV